MNKGVVIGIVIAVAAGLIVYALIPVTLGADPQKMQNNNQYYAYGQIDSSITINDRSAFIPNDSGSTLLVLYNGTIPSNGTSVLVHGEFQNATFLGLSYCGFLVANSVYTWYLAA